MKVLYITYGDLLSNVYGSQLEPLWDELKQKNVQIHALSFVGPSVFLQCSLYRRMQDFEKSSPVPIEISYLGAGFPPRWPKLCIKKIQKKIKKFNPQAIHARGPIAAGLAAKAIESLEIKPKLIYDVRGDTLAEIREGGVVEKRLSYVENEVQKLEKMALEKVSQVFTVSNPLKEMLTKEYSFRGNVEVIPCWGVIPKPYELPVNGLKDTIRKELGIPSHAVVWAYCGSAARWQAISEMFLLFSELKRALPESYFLIISDDLDGMNSEIEKVKLPKEKVKVLSGRRSEVIRWLTAADIAILLREKNAINRVACPMKLADYLLAGLPVLISEGIGDISTWVKQYYVGETVPTLHSNDLLTKALEMYSGIQKRGREDVLEQSLFLFREKLSLEKYIGEYLKAYQK